MLVATEEDESRQSSSSSPARHLSGNDFDMLLRHHRATLRGKFAQLASVLPRGSIGNNTMTVEAGLRTTAEGVVRVGCHATTDIWATLYLVRACDGQSIHRSIAQLAFTRRSITS